LTHQLQYAIFAPMPKHAFLTPPSLALFPAATPPAHRINGGLTVEIALDASRPWPWRRTSAATSDETNYKSIKTIS